MPVEDQNKDKSPCFEIKCPQWSSEQRICVCNKNFQCPLQKNKQ